MDDLKEVFVAMCCFPSDDKDCCAHVFEDLGNAQMNTVLNIASYLDRAIYDENHSMEWHDEVEEELNVCRAILVSDGVVDPRDFSDLLDLFHNLKVRHEVYSITRQVVLKKRKM